MRHWIQVRIQHMYNSYSRSYHIHRYCILAYQGILAYNIMIEYLESKYGQLRLPNLKFEFLVPYWIKSIIINNFRGLNLGIVLCDTMNLQLNKRIDNLSFLGKIWLRNFLS